MQYDFVVPSIGKRDIRKGLHTVIMHIATVFGHILEFSVSELSAHKRNSRVH